MASSNQADGNQMAQLEALRKRLEQTKGKIMAIELRHKQQTRKDDTRLKVLVGAAFLADAEQNEETRAVVRQVVERAIIAPRDRDFLKEKGWL